MRRRQSETPAGRKSSIRVSASNTCTMVPPAVPLLNTSANITFNSSYLSKFQFIGLFFTQGALHKLFSLFICVSSQVLITAEGASLVGAPIINVPSTHKCPILRWVSEHFNCALTGLILWTHRTRPTRLSLAALLWILILFVNKTVQMVFI